MSNLTKSFSIKILNVKINKFTLSETLLKIDDFLKSDSQHYIVTANPEMILAAQKDKEFRVIINKADLVVPDGIGLLWADTFLRFKIYDLRFKNIRLKILEYFYNFFLAIFAGLSLIFYPKYCRRVLPERISGVDLVLYLANRYQNKDIKFFLLGAKEGVAKLAAQKLKQKFPALNIAGTFSGVGDSQGDKITQAIINKAKPDILFVAYGAPKQEKWIARNLENLPTIKLAIGVGGAFDLISGRIPRAPFWMQKMGLEWLWRLIQEPWRIKRIYNATIKFTWLVLKNI